MPDILYDGDFSRPVTTGAPRPEYPFRQNGDRVTSLFEQDYWQRIETFTPREFSTEHEWLRGFYLIGESKPVQILANIFQFTRILSRVPLPQSVPGSLWVTKPAIPGTFPQILGNSLVMQPDASLGKYNFYTRKIASADSGSPFSLPSGGTYTVTVGANTTAAIAYNASAATLQTALNGLTSVSNRGSVAVTGDYVSGFTILFTVYAALTVNTASLLPSATPIVSIVATALSPENGGTQQQFLTMSYTQGPPYSGATFTGGTFTITLFGQTTAPIAYNASEATVAAAITALSKVGSTGTTVKVPSAGTGSSFDGISLLRGDGRVMQLFITLTIPTLSVNAGSLTPAGSAGSVTLPIAGGAPRLLAFTGIASTTRTITAAAHGISAADAIYLKLGATYYTLASGLFGILNANAISLGASSGLLASVDTITEIGRFASVYTAGSVLSRCKRVSTFYLPGVTPGIMTSDDIPLPILESDPVSLVNAILLGSPSINYEVGELAQWRDSPILTRTITTISAAGL